MLAAAVVAGAAIWGTAAWLLGTTSDVLARDAKATGADRPRVEAVRTGLAADAGAGAAVGLMLAFRRRSLMPRSWAIWRTERPASTRSSTLRRNSEG